MQTQPILILITTPSKEVAEQIATQLVEQKLAACVNIVAPVQSIFRWAGAVDEAEEVLLIIKSRAELFHEKLLPVVRAIHPYEVPEIIALPILMGLPEYLNWITEETLSGKD